MAGIWRTFWRREARKQHSFHAIMRTAAPLTPATNHELQTAFQRSELVYACIRLLTTAAQDPRLIVERRQGDGWVEVPDHPFRRLIMRPNDAMTEADLHTAAIASWHTTTPRRFYAEREYENGMLRRLHPLNPLCVAEQYEGDRVVAYRYADGIVTKTLRPDEVLVREAPAWWYPSGLAAAGGSVNGDQAQTAYVATFFANGGVPSGILKIKRHLTGDAADVLRHQWRRKYALDGANAGDVAVLDEDASYERIGSLIGELENADLRQITETRICMAFGVPPLIIYAFAGLQRATYSNLKEAWAGFWDATMSPALREWRDFWTWSLLTEFEDTADILAERVRLRYDLSQVAALQDDVDALLRRAVTAFRGGLITRNEARAQIGVDGVSADEQGDSFGTNSAARVGEIFGYHIQEGVVDINEVRERLGFTPRQDAQVPDFRVLNQRLTVTKQAVDAGMALDAAMRLAGFPESDITAATPPTPAQGG